MSKFRLVLASLVLSVFGMVSVAQADVLCQGTSNAGESFRMQLQVANVASLVNLAGGRVQALDYKIQSKGDCHGENGTCGFEAQCCSGYTCGIDNHCR